MSRINRFIKLTPLYIFAAVLVCFPLYQRHQSADRAQAAASEATQQLTQAPQATQSVIKGVPSRIILPKQGIDLSVVDGTYDTATNNWTVNPKTANYATITPPINNTSGTTLIYGHATDAIFGSTRSLKAGDKAYVYVADNHVFEYEYTGAVTVNPTDTSVFGQLDGDPGLKLLTCSGTWSQNRRIMTFKLTKAV